MINWIYKKLYMMLHTHDWEKKSAIVTRVTTYSDNNTERKRKGSLELKVCRICGKEEATFTDFLNSKIFVNPEMARDRLEEKDRDGEAK